MKILDKHAALYTDMYQLSMAQAYFLNGRENVPACFYYFYRKNPFEGAYVVFAGLSDLLETLEDLNFDEEDIDYLGKNGFHKDFLKYLKCFRFKADIFSVKEGEIIFPYVPIIRVEGNIIEAQLAETILLNLLNFSSLIATKAARMRLVSGNETILTDFGLRRAHGLSAIHGSRASIVGGFNSTSNVYAAFKHDIKAIGTMAHSYIQSYDDELTAFREFATARPVNCVLLVDTYDTIKSGIPNAIKVAKEMKEKGQQLMGLRLDSGDLAYLSKQARRMLNEAGLDYVNIIVSNQIDEYVIKSLLEQKAPIDAFGVGTALLTGQPDASLDGVYKLSMADNKPRVKLSESVTKVTFPGLKQVHRFMDKNGQFTADAITLADENPEGIKEIQHPFEREKTKSLKNLKSEPLLNKVMEKGKRLKEEQNPSEAYKYLLERLKKLPDEYKRFKNPHIYKVGLSTRLNEMRDGLIKKYKSGKNEGTDFS